MILLDIFYKICAIIVIKEFIKNNYNGVYNQYYIDAFCELIYIYSKIQIEINKFTTKKIYPIASSIVNILNKYNIIVKPNNLLEVYNNGSRIFISEIHTTENSYCYSMITNMEYDLCIFSFYEISNNNTKINKVCYHNISNFSDLPEYQISTIKFISLYIIYQENQYDIELMNTKYSYYINNNIIDNSFIKYYLINILNVPITCKDPIEYTLFLCDHNADVFLLDQSDIINIEINSYTIINKNNIVNKITE